MNENKSSEKKKIKILIVEDEKPMAEALELKFNAEGFQALSVHDGEEALAVLAKEPYDFMLLDLIMPKLDGYGMLKKMKALGIEVPFMITSNLSQKSDVETSKELGAREYIIKSNIGVQEIVDKVREQLKMLSEDLAKHFPPQNPESESPQSTP